MQTRFHRVASLTLPRCLLGLIFLLGSAGCGTQPITATSLPTTSLTPSDTQQSATMPAPSIEFKFTPDRDDAQLTADVSGDVATIQIFSQGGIGSADVEIVSATLPKRILLQFHLRSLERLRFTYNKTMVEVSLPQGEGVDPSESVTREGGQALSEPITASDPEWMDVRVVANHPTIPLKEGYIEIEVPRSFWTNDGHRFSIQWIDFYR